VRDIASKPILEGASPMKKSTLAVLAALATLPAVAHAQSGVRSPATTTESVRSSWLPYTSQGYVGINAGRSEYRGDCVGTGGACDRTDTGFRVYTGGLLWRAIGLEVGYINMGKFERGGGTAQAQGANVSLVANAPIGPVNLFGKAGTTYGWTDTSGDGGGDDRGFGFSYGAGVGFDVTRSWQVVAEYDRHRFQFNPGRQAMELWSLGLRYKF